MKLDFELKNFTLGPAGMLRLSVFLFGLATTLIALKADVKKTAVRQDQSDSTRAAEFSAVHLRITDLERGDQEILAMLREIDRKYDHALVPMAKDVDYIKDRMTTLETWRNDRDRERWRGSRRNEVDRGELGPEQ